MSDTRNNEVEVKDDEKGLLLDHDYDGIKELDHPLPSWWIGIFVLTFVFSVPYYIYYEFAGGPSLDDELKADLAKVQEIRKAADAAQGGFDADKYKAFTATSGALTKGKEVYNSKCLACHGDKLQGIVGPNLTDVYWINGNGSSETTFDSINKGVLEKGMPAWSEMLKREEIYAVTAFIESKKGSNPEGAKAPQGTKH